MAGSAYPELAVGPLDPDSSSELTARLGVHNKAQKLLQRHAKNFPPELTAQLARPLDDERTEVVRDHLDAVEEAARSVKGKARFLEDDYEVVDASVRGLPGDRDKIVSVTYFLPSGRPAQGVFSWDALGLEDEVERRAALAEGGGAPAVITDEDAAAAVRQAEEARVQAEGELQEMRERLDALEDPEPYEGYEAATADEVIARVKEGGAGEFGTAGLDKIAEYEEEHKNRSTVLAAVSDARDAAQE